MTAVPVTVYTKPACVQCTATKKHLDRQGTPYHLVDISLDPEARAYVVDTLGYLQAPVVTAGDMHWSGYSPDKCDALGKLHTVAADIHALDAEAEAYLAQDEGEALLANAYLTDENAAARLVTV
ncbi:glutaredoxin family protein [Rhodococcus opacus]|nr:glutaredoxin family protein [Rhodococcus opacus]